MFRDAPTCIEKCASEMSFRCPRREALAPDLHGVVFAGPKRASETALTIVSLARDRNASPMHIALSVMQNAVARERSRPAHGLHPPPPHKTGTTRFVSPHHQSPRLRVRADPDRSPCAAPWPHDGLSQRCRSRIE